MSGGGMWRGWAWLALAGIVVVGAPPAAAQGMDPWAAKRQWMSVRAGYAKSAAEGSADGNVGFGFGYTRFRNTKWSYGAHVQVDVLGRFADAYQLEIPWTLEVVRHYRWATAMRPYLGVGAGAFYEKVQGTSQDYGQFSPGTFLVGGSNTALSEHGLLGFDVRVAMVSLDHQDNPVFGGDATAGKHQTRAVHWSAKLNYAWAF